MDLAAVALILVVALPIAWLVAEFSERRGLRILLGVLAIAMSFFVAFIVGSLEALRANSYYGHTSKFLIDTTVTELEAEHAESVLDHLKELQANYRPTYKWRANYEELVDAYAKGMGAPERDREQLP